MLQILGIGNYATNHGAVWYVSSLFVSSLILYFCQTFLYGKSRYFVYIIFIVIGYLSQYIFGSLCIVTWESPIGFTLLPGLIRGLSEMSIGIICYYLGRYLNNRNIWDNYRRIFIAVEYVLMILVVLYLYKNLDRYIVVIITLAIAITISYWCKHNINVKFIRSWENLTYPIYLNHPIIIILFQNKVPLVIYLIIVTLYSVCTSYIVDVIVGKVKLILRKRGV